MIGEIYIYNKHFPFAYENSPWMKTMEWEELLRFLFKPIHWTWDEQIVTILPYVGRISVYKSKSMLSLDQNSSQSMFRQRTLPATKCAQYGSLYTPVGNISKNLNFIYQCILQVLQAAENSDLRSMYYAAPPVDISRIFAFFWIIIYSMFNQKNLILRCLRW